MAYFKIWQTIISPENLVEGDFSSDGVSSETSTKNNKKLMRKPLRNHLRNKAN